MVIQQVGITKSLLSEYDVDEKYLIFLPKNVTECLVFCLTELLNVVLFFSN